MIPATWGSEEEKPWGKGKNFMAMLAALWHQPGSFREHRLS